MFWLKKYSESILNPLKKYIQTDNMLYLQNIKNRILDSSYQFYCRRHILNLRYKTLLQKKLSFLNYLAYTFYQFLSYSYSNNCKIYNDPLPIIIQRSVFNVREGNFRHSRVSKCQLRLHLSYEQIMMIIGPYNL